MEGVTLIFIVMIGITFYFLPSIIQEARGARHGSAIFLVNLLFGWTILGWIAALIWAITERTEAASHTSAP